MSKPKYYITTAIAYASGKPHIGNTYEIVLADSIARFKREQGYDVFFQTGTDEPVSYTHLTHSIVEGHEVTGRAGWLIACENKKRERLGMLSG